MTFIRRNPPKIEAYYYTGQPKEDWPSWLNNPSEAGVWRADGSKECKLLATGPYRNGEPSAYAREGQWIVREIGYWRVMDNADFLAEYESLTEA